MTLTSCSPLSSTDAQGQMVAKGEGGRGPLSVSGGDQATPCSPFPRMGEGRGRDTENRFELWLSPWLGRRPCGMLKLSEDVLLPDSDPKNHEVDLGLMTGTEKKEPSRMDLAGELGGVRKQNRWGLAPGVCQIPNRY